MTVDWKAIKANSDPNRVRTYMLKGEIWQRIHRFCIECIGSAKAASNCDGVMTLGPCSLQPYRLGHKDTNKPEAPIGKTKLKQAIRYMWNECMSSTTQQCSSPGCELRPIRWQEKKTVNHNFG